MGPAHPVCGHDHLVAEVALVRDSQAEHLVRDPGVDRELAEADDDERRQSHHGEDQDQSGLPGRELGALRGPENEETNQKT